MKSQVNVEEEPESTEVEYLDDIDFKDDVIHDITEPSVSDDITVTKLQVKGKRGRPKKSAVKVEKVKVPKQEDKPRPSKVVKGKQHAVATEAESKSSMTTTKRNRLMKRNAIIILESSTVIPFKWHRHNYLCFFCHQAFKNVEPLKEHTKTNHEKTSIKSAVSYLKRDEKVKIDVSELLCRLCTSNFDNVNSLINHIKVNHGRIFSEDCGYGIVPYKLYENKFECSVCEKDFKYFIKLNQHMNEHYGNYVCELCGKSFLSQDRLRCHSLSHGSGFHCNECSEIFDSLTQRTSHEYKVHNKKRSIRCLFCSETFQNYILRKRHHHSAHNVEVTIVKCPVCAKPYNILSKMLAHLKEVHVREKNFSCSMCEQKFFSKTHVQKHMIKHLGERVHECAVCKKSYARKQTLRDHMRIHNNDKRFTCSICNQAFVQNNSLRLHLKVHHSDQTT